MIASLLYLSCVVLIAWPCVSFWRANAIYWTKRAHDAEQRCNELECELIAAATGATRSEVSIELELATYYMDIDAIRVAGDL